MGYSDADSDTIEALKCERDEAIALVSSHMDLIRGLEATRVKLERELAEAEALLVRIWESEAIPENGWKELYDVVKARCAR